jgi:long-chain acyl-CoA synthetase
MITRAAERVQRSLYDNAEHLAFIAGERSLTFDAVKVQSLSLSQALRDLGVVSGDAIMICLSDSVDAMLSYLACWWLGATPMIVDFRLRPSERRELAKIAGISLTLETRSTKVSNSYKSAVWDDRWLFTPVDPNLSSPDLEKNRPAAFSLSSGTTGKPKVYVQSHKVLDRRIMARRFSVEPGKTRLLTPMMLSFSATRHLVLDFLCGGGCILFEPPLFSASELAERLVSTKVNATALAPSVIHALLREIGPRKAPFFANLEMMRSVGGPASPEDKVAAYRYLTPGYRMSYSSGLTGPIARLGGTDVLERPDSVGRPVEQARVTIVDPETLAPLPTGEKGLIRVASDTVVERVIAPIGQTAERFGRGWGIPGDIGVLDDAGYLSIIGREADMIVRGGVNVAPQELERVLLAAEGVAEVAVAGIDDVELGQEIAAFFVSNLDEVELHKICMRLCTPDRRPRIIKKVASLPLNAGGKLQRALLAKQLDTQ